MYRIPLKASAFAMSYISSEEKVRTLARAVAPRTDHHAPFIGAGGIKVAAVRFNLRRYKSLHDFIYDINEYIEFACAAGSHLVAFPELCGMAALSIMPKYSLIASHLMRLKNAGDEQRAAALYTVCETSQGFLSEIFHNTFSVLARNHRVIIAAGGLYQIEDKKLYNRQFLFSEDGDVAGIQDKLMLSSAEKRLGVSAGESLTPADTNIGRVALLSGGMLPHYEPFWLSRAMDCSIAVAGASPFLISDSDLARFRAQEERLCIISPSICGGEDLGLGLSFSAPAGVYAPRSATRTRDGISAGEDENRCACARVDLERAKMQIDLYSDDRNARFMQHLVSEKKGTP